LQLLHFTAEIATFQHKYDDLSGTDEHASALCIAHVIHFLGGRVLSSPRDDESQHGMVASPCS